MNETNKISVLNTLFFYLLFFLSGFIALVYEVLWMKELGLLFGNTAQAAATVLTAFFLGLGCGNFLWGRRAEKIKNPLRAYGYLELGVAVSAVGYFAILYAYRAAYPLLFENFFATPEIFLATKFFLSLLLLFPPAFFMGGTLPVMSQFLVRQKNWMGQQVSLLYATNTLGASCGTMVAGFLLPRFLGFNLSFMVAMGVNLLIAIAAILLSDKKDQSAGRGEEQSHYSERQLSSNFMYIAGIAFISGLITLSLQVLWIRMFSQVLHNSVYDFSLILTVFLVILAFGSCLANQLMKWRINPESSLIVILLIAGVLIVVSPAIFYNSTSGLTYMEGGQGWLDYILAALMLAVIVMGPALILLGTILPMTFKLVEKDKAGVGYLIGLLTSINTLGAVMGSLLAGFILLETVGLWQAIHLVGSLCFAAAVLLSFRRFSETARWVPFTLGLLLYPVVSLNMTRLPNVTLAEDENEKLVELWQGSSGTVAVTESVGSQLRIKVNNSYNLGGTGASILEELQTDIPMQLHGAARNVYVLGLGSGITAGAALKYPITELTVTELVPEVIEASRKHFAPFLHGLFTDPRANVIAEDGRNFLEGSNKRYDLVIADLFLPWKSGTGYLYTREHFASVAQRLEKDGMFMQWLPSHQITEEQFNIIVKTFVDVFPRTTLWRGDFFHGVSILGLLGHKHPQPFLQSEVKKAVQVAPLKNIAVNKLPLLSYYVANLGEQKQSFAGSIINQDDFPVIVYDSPITQRQRTYHQVDFLAGSNLMQMVTKLRKTVPIASDPFLRQLTANDIELVEMGHALHEYDTNRANGNQLEADQQYLLFKETYERWKN